MELSLRMAAGLCSAEMAVDPRPVTAARKTSGHNGGKKNRDKTRPHVPGLFTSQWTLAPPARPTAKVAIEVQGRSLSPKALAILGCKGPRQRRIAPTPDLVRQGRWVRELTAKAEVFHESRGRRCLACRIP